MLGRYRFCACFLALGLLVGCGSQTSRRHKSSPAETSFTTVVESAPDRPASKLAQAHAHYAAAVIHEMNEETEAALEEFYKAGLDDVENEDLVLEVTRRLLQNKQQEKALELL